MTIGIFLRGDTGGFNTSPVVKIAVRIACRCLTVRRKIASLMHRACSGDRRAGRVRGCGNVLG